MKRSMQRDEIGIGGSWSEFVDYLVVSLTSGTVKLTLDGSSTAPMESGLFSEEFLLICLDILSVFRARSGDGQYSDKILNCQCL